MVIRSIEVRLSRKRSENFNSTEVSIGLAADLEPGEDVSAAIQALREQCKQEVAAGFRSLTPGTPQSGQ